MRPETEIYFYKIDVQTRGGSRISVGGGANLPSGRQHTN